MKNAPSPRSIPKLRVAGIAAAALLLAWLALAVGAANALRGSDPAAALLWRGDDSRAKAGVAERLSDQPNRAAEAERLVLSSLSRDLTYPPAVRTLALLHARQGDVRLGRALFQASDRLSRADLPTRLWLIEERVAADDIPGALRHYDIALRTSRQAEQLLFPILAQAASEPAVAKSLAPVLARDPLWAWTFLWSLADGPKPSVAASLLIELGRLDALPDQTLPRYVLGKLERTGEHRLAWNLYREVARRPVQLDRVRNGSFDREDEYPPFDWSISTDADVAAGRSSLGGNHGPVLSFSTRTSATTAVARQMLGLSPGEYRLEALAGSIPAGTPLSWAVACAGETPRPLLRAQVPASGESGTRHGGKFAVPAGCPFQLLTLDLAVSGNPEGAQGWIDSVAIVPARS